ncbi:WYL domain-containing protein [Synechocystis sp. FACHB-383]|uniref:AAA family ATPase n=1 Tax=Synechocystis sp. FACHB-383 TaxID=2692864 RepID=UPI00168932BF|nr:AAA family ATPase [Synechocystis sp. FACHB-383]MBD2654606.1 WYL domain-containing protein [Synechocystis sp. FACHB-383]
MSITTVFCLIGCTSSGKSTLANNLIKQNPNYQIISTDKVRAQLFGDESIQGNWQQIEDEIFRQIKEHIDSNHSVIYDATNAKRPWRMELIQKIKQLSDIDIIGIHLKTPLDICKRWNQQRDRQVPEFVIDDYFQALKQFPPIPAEGFTAVIDIPFKDGSLDLSKLGNQLTKVSRSQINRRNRTQNRKVELHQYSRLLDFDRLMHLISLLIHYPGIGNLQYTDPKQLEAILGTEQKFETEIDEICAIISKIYHPIYANKDAINRDLDWLQTNNLIGINQNPKEITLSPLEDPDLITHPYSEKDAFCRLIKTIRFILHNPLLHNPEATAQETFINEIESQGIVEFNSGNSIRKDIEKILKPYQILPNISLRRGYFAGTSILSESDLLRVFKLLEAQANGLDDPLALGVYERFKERLSHSYKLDKAAYPVRVIHNRNIVDLDSLPRSSLAGRIHEVEQAIENAYQLEVKYFKGVGRFSKESDNFFMIYPIQLVFHNIGWYLGFEMVNAEQSGLLKFGRIDRLFLSKVIPIARSPEEQNLALQKLETLCQSCGGIFLGNNVTDQKNYLSHKVSHKKSVEIEIELWFSDYMFRFVSEGNKRFPLKQMRMSPKLDQDQHRKSVAPYNLPKTGDEQFPNRFRVTLPKWMLEDIDFRRWIIGFGNQVKIICPPELVSNIQAHGESIAKVYSSDH